MSVFLFVVLPLLFLSSAAVSALSFALTTAQIVSISPDETFFDTILLCSQKFMKAAKVMLKMSGSPAAFSLSE